VHCYYRKAPFPHKRLLFDYKSFKLTQNQTKTNKTTTKTTANMKYLSGLIMSIAVSLLLVSGAKGDLCDSSGKFFPNPNKYYEIIFPNEGTMD
jgi:hypothetical protein